MTELIETAPHEFTAQYNFDGGLRPYFALDSIVKDYGGSATSEFRHHGEAWDVTLYHQDSNIVNPGDTTPAGTPFEIEEVREFRISVEAVDDETGERGFNAHIRPRWDGYETEDKYGSIRSKSIPFTEGVNVRIQGSNIEFDQYLPLFQQAARSLEIDWTYFDTPHDSSNVEQAERYVRLSENVSGPVHARDGPLARMGHLLESDRHGTRRTEQTDMDERGEQSPGYRHQVGVDEVRVQEVWPNHALPKQVKHYYAREHQSMPDDHPLSHPKVGAIYYPSLWRDSDGQLGVSPADLRQLTDELEETVLGTLHDAGISVTDAGPFVEDSYFDATLSDRDRQVVELPLQDIKERQESVVMQHVADGLSPVEWESLKTLATDGGEVSPADIADAGGFHRDSVYRALDRMDELVDTGYDSVELKSTYVGELVHEAVQSAKKHVRDAVEAGAKAMEAAERGLDDRTSAFVAFAARHFDEWRETDDGVSLDFGTVEADDRKEARKEVRRKLREGAELWRDMRNDVIQWRLGSYRAKIRYEKEPELKYYDREAETVTERLCGDIWRQLQLG